MKFVKEIFWLVMSLVLASTGVGCSASEAKKDLINEKVEHSNETMTSKDDASNAEKGTPIILEMNGHDVQATLNDTQTEQTTISTQIQTNNNINIHIGEHTLTATLEDNSSAAALKELIAQQDLVIDMSDYANMEKVGAIGKDLPRNDMQTTTEAGDLILYLGNSFVIYYDTNSWDFTRLGKIDDITAEELKEILGTGDVTVTLSLK